MSTHPSFDLSVSLRFEPFFALWSLLTPDAGVHRAWASAGRAALGRDARAALQRLHGAAPVWLALGDLAGRGPPGVEVADLLAVLGGYAPEDFATELLAVLLGARPAARSLIEGGAELGELLSAFRPAARARPAFFGLGFFGLGGAHPGGAHPDDAMRRLVGDLVAEPAAIQAAMLDALAHFWSDVFAATWDRLRPALTASLARRRAEVGNMDWWRQWQGSQARQEGLALQAPGIEIDPLKRELRAQAGDLSLPFNRIAKIHVFPSAFNERRVWSLLDGPTSRRHVYFPYFDAAIDVPPTDVPPASAKGVAQAGADQHGDVALVFRALGDATRFSIASLIARQPLSATEIARRLGLSKPTLTHHLKEMRRTGLIEETGNGRTRFLALNRAAIGAISDRAIRALFDMQGKDRFSRSRRGRTRSSS